MPYHPDNSKALRFGFTRPNLLDLWN